MLGAQEPFIRAASGEPRALAREGTGPGFDSRAREERRIEHPKDVVEEVRSAEQDVVLAFYFH